MNEKTIRVVAAVVDTRNLTLYKENGETIIIPQGDARLRKIIEEATPQLVKQGWADVNITQYDEPSYADFEREGSGAVKFFRIAKSKLKQLFNPEPAMTTSANTSPVPPLSIGPVPVSAAPTALPVVQPATPAPFTVIVSVSAVQVVAAQPQLDDEPEEDGIQHETSEPVVKHTMDVVNEILAHAIPVSSPDFHEETVAKQGNVVEMDSSTDKGHGDDSKPDTIIAVVDGKVIPGMERIKTQFGRAAKLGSTAGVEAFLKRLAATIETRSHSVEDLLKFLERADLPIAEDGSILIYKVLRKISEGKYVDCHTRKVEQFVGAYVCMDPKMVDHNRNNECSNGLHVARRGYIGSFSGDVCVLAKLAPEDVITIPTYDANKMRVCGYHIIAELSDAQYRKLQNNRPITDNEEGQKLLAMALAGSHIRRTHEVRITGSMGGGVVTTVIPEHKVTMADIPASLVSAAADATEIFGDDELERFAEEQRSKEAKPVVEKAMALSNPGGPHSNILTNPIDVVRVVAKVTEEVQLSRKEQAKVLYDAWESAQDPAAKAERLTALLAFKKRVKKGWDVLGIPDPTVKVKGIVKVALAPKPNTTPKLFPEVKEVKPKPAHADAVAKLDRKVVKDDKGLPVSTKNPPMPKVNPPKVEASKEEGPPKQRIAKLLAIGLDSAGIAASVLTIKKSAKKSWEILGVSKAQVAEILKQTGKS